MNGINFKIRIIAKDSVINSYRSKSLNRNPFLIRISIFLCRSRSLKGIVNCTSTGVSAPATASKYGFSLNPNQQKRSLEKF
jgi:hypothetical protein